MPEKRILSLATVLLPGLLLGIGVGFEVQAASLYQDYRQSLVSSQASDFYAKTQEAALWRDRFYTGGLISLALPLGLLLGNEWYYGDQTASLESKLATLAPGMP